MVGVSRRRFLKGLGAVALLGVGVDVYEDGELDANAYRGTPGDYIVPENATVDTVAAETTLHARPYDGVFNGTYGMPEGLVDEPDALYLETPDDITFGTVNDILRYGELDHWEDTETYLENGAVGDCGEYVNATLSILGANGHPGRAVRGFLTDAMLRFGGGAPLAPLHLVGEVEVGGEVYVLENSTPHWLWPRDRFEAWLGEQYGWEPFDMYGEGGDWEAYNADWHRAGQ